MDEIPISPDGGAATVRELVMALLQMPMDSIVEVRHPDLHRAAHPVSVSEMPNIAYGAQYVNLDVA